MPQTLESLKAFFLQGAVVVAPQLHLLIWGMGILCIGVLLPKDWNLRLGKRVRLDGNTLAALLAVVALLLAGLELYLRWDALIDAAFFDMITLDHFARFFDALFLIAALLAVIISYRYLEVENESHSEYYALLLFATSGMMFLAGALDLVTIFVSLELMSLSTYVLVGFLRRQKRSNEAALKYFLLGAFSTGVILYGMSLLYGLTGSTQLDEIARSLADQQSPELLALSMFMLMAGLCFKIAAVPFHMWVPDAYEGAPTAITGFMSVAVKAAAFAIFFRLFLVLFDQWREWYVLPLALIAMITMTWGNVAAVTQENVKRLLAYSSISHAGYVLMGLVAGTDLGVTASAVYLLAYTFMNLGIWSVVILLRRLDIPGERVEDFNGLFFKHPALAVLMLLFLLSLTGIPPLAGFIAKYFVFAAVIEVALTDASLTSLMVWLAVVGAVNAVVGLYYYLRIVLAMFFREEYLPAPLSFSTGVAVALVIAGIFTLWIGIYPGPFVDLARTASIPLL